MTHAEMEQRVALLAGGELSAAEVAIAEYSPAQVKKSVTGSGRASKEQVSFMVERLSGATSDSHDVTDAVAVALCHQAHARLDLAAERRAGAERGA